MIDILLNFLFILHLYFRKWRKESSAYSRQKKKRSIPLHAASLRFCFLFFLCILNYYIYLIIQNLIHYFTTNFQIFIICVTKIKKNAKYDDHNKIFPFQEKKKKIIDYLELTFLLIMYFNHKGRDRGVFEFSPRNIYRTAKNIHTEHSIGWKSNFKFLSLLNFTQT